MRPLTVVVEEAAVHVPETVPCLAGLASRSTCVPVQHPLPVYDLLPEGQAAQDAAPAADWVFAGQ